MKNIFTVFLLCTLCTRLFAQDKSLNLKDLAVPSSPAFVITDITPSLVQNPNTPKAFVLGLAQSLAGSDTGFPNNFSAEFAPYWWVQKSGKSVYNFLGISPGATKEKVFEGIKFTTVSVAFINKDLIPDNETTEQKAFSIGAHSTILKVHRKGWAALIDQKITAWHSAAIQEITDNQDLQAEMARNPNLIPEILKRYKTTRTNELMEEINDLINQKPTFVWDLATAYSAYGINGQQATTGRVAAWSTLSTYIHLGKSNSYFTISGSARYLVDHYQKNDAGVIGRVNNVDIGGKAGFQLNQVNIGVESLYRSANGIVSTQNRTVGVISVKLSGNLYFNGAFGKDFAGPNKLISIFGINWGFGKDAVELP